jgi:hypothetical protein
MPRIKIENLRKIPIREVCQDGWIKRIGNLQIMLQHLPEGICLFVDVVKQQQVLWKVYERTIAGNISYRGGFIPTDRAWDWYVYGRDGKRYKHLYLQILGPNNFSRYPFPIRIQHHLFPLLSFQAQGNSKSRCPVAAPLHLE